MYTHREQRWFTYQCRLQIHNTAMHTALWTYSMRRCVCVCVCVRVVLSVMFAEIVWLECTDSAVCFGLSQTHHFVFTFLSPALTLSPLWLIKAAVSSKMPSKFFSDSNSESCRGKKECVWFPEMEILTPTVRQFTVPETSQMCLRMCKMLSELS